MANINSKNAARKKVREAQARANEARQERERLNVDDAASFLVEVGRLAAVDEWEQGRVDEIHAEANRRRHEHRQEGAAAVSGMVDRGETPTAIAKLAGVKVSEVRAMLKSAEPRPIAPPDAVAASAEPRAAGASQILTAGAGVTAGDAAPPGGVGEGLYGEPVRGNAMASGT
jgi:hypothetical protein